MRQPLIERERDRLLLAAVEPFDAVAHRVALRHPRAAARSESVPGVSNSISLSSSSRVIVTVSGSRRRSWSRQRLRTMLVSHVCGFAFAVL
jgi:hypothetical protein